MVCLLLVSVVVNQAGDACDEDRAEQPARDDLQPQVITQHGAANRNLQAEDGVLARGAFIRPPVLLLTKIYERHKHVERVEHRMKSYHWISRRWRCAVRPLETHDTGALANRHDERSENYDCERPHDCA